MIYDWKYFTDDPAHRASRSHGSQSIWLLFSLALKKPPMRSFLSAGLSKYSVEPRAGFLVAASKTIHKLSLFCGIVIIVVSEEICAWAFSNAAIF